MIVTLTLFTPELTNNYLAMNLGFKPSNTHTLTQVKCFTLLIRSRVESDIKAENSKCFTQVCVGVWHAASWFIKQGVKVCFSKCMCSPCCVC